MYRNTDTKMQVLAIIMRNGLRPSTREICAELDLWEFQVQKIIKELVAEGLVSHEPRRARTLMPMVRFIPVEELL